MAKNIAKEIKDLQQYHSVGHQCETIEDRCPAIQGKRKDCNCGWKEYEDAVIKIATAQKGILVALIEDRRGTVNDYGRRLVRDIWVEDLLRAVKGL
ncbi:hypothetical protein LCGC14_1482810 [marine sediment metagenome]|uniref:Uncharacterized protein n=1 Tax=marine sediment metagenome TaxID=412755 RepID=A0A0F9JV09_9ZZZZ